ncbi:MAG: hypothetical protein H7296_08540, partial [Bacteroidia bacterium]|nr:hypothetical protein [Bacteroidia bacterium]
MLPFYGFSQTPTLTIDPTLITTLAGNLPGFSNASGSNAQFNLPTGITTDPSGNIYIADYNNNVIRKITPVGVVTTFAGTGVYGFLDGAGSVARFRSPTGITSDQVGNIYVADQFNHKIRKISPSGVVSSVAGDGLNGYVNGTAANARFNFPTCLAVDLSGNLYVADQYNHVIRKISSLGIVSTLAGSGVSGFKDDIGTLAQFNLPTGIAVDSNGLVYVADYNNNRIRKITATGIVTTLAGTGIAGAVDGAGNQASFYNPTGVFADALQNIYVADKNNLKIRKISPLGLVSTIAGSGSWGADDGMGLIAKFGDPYNIAKDISGNFYVADANNHRVRKISTLQLDPFITPQNTASAAEQFLISGRNLTNNVLITPPVGYQISLDGSSYSSSLILSPINGEVAKIIFIRLSANASVGNSSGNISIASTGAVSLSLAVNGTVTGTPFSAFTVTNNSCLNRTVSFTDLSSLATSWLWNFGDGTTS